MPPRAKVKLKEGEIREYAAQYEIEFKGPVEPKYWPERHRHHFQVIREIWGTRYDKYINRSDIDPRKLNRQRTRVRQLRKRTKELREDRRPSEAAWRDNLEGLVIKHFQDEIGCMQCGNENVQPDYEAQPFEDIEKEKLDHVRRCRRACTCNESGGVARAMSTNSDDHIQMHYFKTLVDEPVNHDPEDGLQATRIPMKPDRIIALYFDEKYRKVLNSSKSNLIHHPFSTTHFAFHPFLVVEAKREDKVPGFSAIEAQSSFPIRRFLKIQDNLRKKTKVDHDPLVWFLAFRGDEWRLYAGTLDGETVRIYNLWLGLLESADGALQLLQIIDFIWSWARDVYRPKIIHCLRAAYPTIQEISPSVSLPPSRSQSFCSNARAQTPSVPLPGSDQTEDVGMIQQMRDYQAHFPSAISHRFLRWAAPGNEIIRHSDIVLFRYCSVEVPEKREEFEQWIRGTRRGYERSFLEDPHHHDHTTVLSRSQVLQIGRIWTGKDLLVTSGLQPKRLDEVVRALVFFRTYCRQTNWQIIRELNFLIWSPAATTLFKNIVGDINLGPDDDNQMPMSQSDLIKEIQSLRGLSGKLSVGYALQELQLLLGSNSQFARSIDDPWPPKPPIHLFNVILTAISLHPGARFDYQRSLSLALVAPTIDDEAYSSLPSVPADFAQGGALLAVRPDPWPLQCAKFCLFIKNEKDFDDAHTLGEKLRFCLSARAFYGNPQPLTEDDRSALKKWVRSLLN